jgi:hypothetical protein
VFRSLVGLSPGTSHLNLAQEVFGVLPRPCMDELMDSDDESMFATLMEEEAEIVVTDDEEHLMMLSCLIALYAHNDVKPRHGGSALGHRKSKPRQRLEGYCILYADYFADDPLHGEVVFRRCFRMSWKLFLDIVYVVWRFDNYFICKKYCTGMVGFFSLRSALLLCGCLHMELLVIHRMITYAWPSLWPWSAYLNSAGQWCQCSDQRTPNEEDTARVLA